MTGKRDRPSTDGWMLLRPITPDPIRPPDTDDEPWVGLDRHRSRDLALLCFAGIAILVLLAWALR